MRWRVNKQNDTESGQAMVEWALIFPVFLMLICGIMDFGWFGYQQLMFEGSCQATSWDFPLKLQLSPTRALTDADVLAGTLPPDYDINTPANVVQMPDGSQGTLGAGIQAYTLVNAPGGLDRSRLSISEAVTTFKCVPVTETYRAGSSAVSLETFQVQANLAADVTYNVKMLTPLGRGFFPQGVDLKKTLSRKRVERVVIKRQVTVPAI